MFLEKMWHSQVFFHPFLKMCITWWSGQLLKAGNDTYIYKYINAYRYFFCVFLAGGEESKPSILFYWVVTFEGRQSGVKRSILELFLLPQIDHDKDFCDASCPPSKINVFTTSEGWIRQRSCICGSCITAAFVAQIRCLLTKTATEQISTVLNLCYQLIDYWWGKLFKSCYPVTVCALHLWQLHKCGHTQEIAFPVMPVLNYFF